MVDEVVDARQYGIEFEALIDARWNEAMLDALGQSRVLARGQDVDGSREIIQWCPAGPARESARHTQRHTARSLA